MTADAPFFAEVAEAPEGARAHWITASDGVRLRAVFWPTGDRGTAVIFPGRTEFAEKYGRVAARLAERGLSVLVIDWRGQGLSDRHPSHGTFGHVEDFRHYQRDAAALLELRAELDLPAPLYLVAHSMGGCIGLRTLVEGGDFRAAVFSAPMWRLHMKAATREVVARMARTASLLGLGGRLTPGTKADPTMTLGFEDNALTSHRETFEWCASQIAAHPELALGGPTLQWTYAAIEEMTRLRRAPPPRTPMLVLLGSEETVVSPTVIRTEVARMAHGELLELSGARHEIFMEGPETQRRVWQRIDSFLESVADRHGQAGVAAS